MDNLRSCFEAAWGCVVIAFVSAHWVGLFHGVNIVLTFVMTLTGAVIGVHGVIGFIRKRNRTGSFW